MIFANHFETAPLHPASYLPLCLRDRFGQRFLGEFLLHARFLL